MELTASRPSAVDEATTGDDARSQSPTFEELAAGHIDFVWRLLRRLGLSSADAEDATRQVLLVAAGKLDQITASKARTFLYGVALRVASNAPPW